MSVQPKRLANKKTRNETGLDYVPFGSRLIKDQKPFFPGQEEELRAELARVQRMSEIAGANEREISVLQETFMMMKDNSFTIERSATAALSVVEIFEVKSLLLLIDKVRKTADNPKRRQRDAHKQVQNSGIGTKSQQALQMQREEMKTERKLISKEQKEAEKQRQFDLKQQKRKEKHKGH